ncbi:MAG: hypothetical protein V9F03_09880 [Microthrixaceae bacterium]
MVLAAEKVWHFWIAVPLAASAILLVLSLVGLYVAKVSRTRYPSSHS